MRVLQIEGDAETAQTVTMILKSDGHGCDTADCGARALELARDDDYDIILLDIGLPDSDGYEVLNKLRARRHDARHHSVGTRASEERGQGSRCRGLPSQAVRAA